MTFLKDKVKPQRKGRPAWVITAGIMLFAVVLAVAVILVSRKMEEKKFHDYIVAADKYLQDANYKEAEEKYLKAIEIDPRQEEPYLKLADVYEKQDKQKLAMIVIEQGEQSVGKSKKLTQKKKELKNPENTGEKIKTEGYFSYDSEEMSVVVSVLDGEDEKNILSLRYRIENGDSSDSVRFQWESGSEKYEQVEGETKGEYEIAVKEKDGSILVSLSDEKNKKNVFQNVILEKHDYFNSTNAILAIKEYIRSGESELLKEDSVRLPMNEAEVGMYGEQLLIPVYEAGQGDEKNPIYKIVVTSQAFEEAGEAAMYTVEEFQKIMDGTENFRTVNPVEEFDVNDYFTFE